MYGLSSTKLTSIQIHSKKMKQCVTFDVKEDKKKISSWNIVRRSGVSDKNARQIFYYYYYYGSV